MASHLVTFGVLLHFTPGRHLHLHIGISIYISEPPIEI